MTMNNEIKEYLADRYFSGLIPGNLVRYLYDRYGEEPLERDLSPQFFWPNVIGDIKDYLNGTLDIRLRSPLQKLQDRYDELSGITSSICEDKRRLETELTYLYDFIRYIHQEDLFEKFKKYAHEEEDEYGFKYFTM